MKKKVVIIGGGFAGVQLVKHLSKKDFDILLIDKLNHHQFQPLFYQVATSQIEPSSISFPFRHIFKNESSVQIRLAEVNEINTKEKKVETSIGAFDYDYLIVACGCKTNYFGNSEIENYAFSLKTTYDAISLRNHILLTFERVLSANEIEREKLLNLVIVGAGPTGVELAGAFAEIKEDVLPKDYPGIDFSKFSIYLIEGSKNTLNAMSEKARSSSKMYLKQMGVKVYTETFVKHYDGENLSLSTGEEIHTSTVIWAAGVTGNIIQGLPDKVWNKANRIIVDRYNQVSGLEGVFAVGDIAYMTTPKYPNGHPQVANVAINQAKLLASNLKQLLAGKSREEYEYRDMGAMATIGRNKAVVDLPFVKFRGYFAWFVWMLLHLMLILSVRNKVIIFINWAWNYISKNSSLRLILKQNSGEKNE